MARRVRYRSLSDDAVSDLLVDEVVAMMLAPPQEALEAAVRVERIHREWSDRHRRRRVLGCTCAVCCRQHRPTA